MPVDDPERHGLIYRLFVGYVIIGRRWVEIKRFLEEG
jgi:hypothetical protein